VARLFIVLIVVAITVYAFIDCLRSDDGEAQHLPRPIWLIVTLVPLVGGIAWLVLGRVRESALYSSPSTRPRTVAPDDDPEFLRSLDRWRRRDRTEPPPRPDPAAPPQNDGPGTGKGDGKGGGKGGAKGTADPAADAADRGKDRDSEPDPHRSSGDGSDPD
jgi:Phospholipase_D-nuclease N-terminal